MASTIDLKDVYRRADDSADYQKVFMKKLEETQKEYAKKSIPLCTACAILDFNEDVMKLKLEAERMLGFGPKGTLPDEVLPQIKEIKELPLNFNYAKYIQGYELLGEAELRENRINPMGEKLNVLTGYNLNYSCKRYKHGNAVQVDLETYDNLKKGNKRAEIEAKAKS